MNLPTSEMGDPLLRVIRRPDTLANAVSGLDAEQQPAFVAEIIKRVAGDDQLAFEALADSSGRWAVAWQHAGEVLSRSRTRIEGFPARIDETSMCAYLFERSARPLFPSLLAQIPPTDSMRRFVCAVIFGLLKRGEWRKWHTVLRGLDAGLVNSWLLECSRGTAGGLVQAPVVRFSPLFSRSDNFAACEGFAVNYLDANLAAACSPDDAMASYRNELLRRAELTFEERVLGLGVLLAQVQADPLTELEPLLGRLGLGLSDLDGAAAWFLNTVGPRPALKELELSELMPLLSERPEIQRRLHEMGVSFDLEAEVIRAFLHRMRTQTSGSATGFLGLSLDYLESALGSAAQQEVLELFAPAWGLAPEGGSLARALCTKLTAEDGGVGWLAGAFTRSNLIRSLADAPVALRASLRGLPLAATPAALMAAAVQESLAAAGSAGRARLLVLLARWHRGESLGQFITGWQADAADAFVHGQVFAFAGDWTDSAVDRAVAADLVRVMVASPDVPAGFEAAMQTSAASAWSHLTTTWRPDLPAEEAPFAPLVVEVLSRMVASRIAGGGRFDAMDMEAGFGIGLDALISAFESGAALPVAVLAERLLRWMHRTPAASGEFARVRGQLSLLRYRALGGVGDPMTSRSKLAVACRHSGGLQSRNDILQSAGVRADELDAWTAQFLDGSIDCSGTEVVAARVMTDAGRPAGRRIKVKMRPSTLWPRIAIALALMGYTAFAVAYYLSPPPLAIEPAGAPAQGATVDLETVLRDELGLRRIDPGASPVQLGVGDADRTNWAAYADLGAEDALSLGRPRQVTLAPYWIGATPVRNLELERSIPSSSGGGRRPAFQSGQTGDRQPAVNVTYRLAADFCRTLTAALVARFPADFAPGGRFAGWVVRLPTDEEWEFAAAGGRRGPFWWGQSWSEMPAPLMETLVQSGGTVESRTSEGWSNAYGLVGFHFNVAEWVSAADRPGQLQELFPGHQVRGSGWPAEKRPEWQRGVHFARVERNAREWLGFRLVFAPGRP